MPFLIAEFQLLNVETDRNRKSTFAKQHGNNYPKIKLMSKHMI